MRALQIWPYVYPIPRGAHPRVLDGRTVEVFWTNPEWDWPYFVVLRETPSGVGFVLRGADGPRLQAKHEGDSFNAYWHEIRGMRSVVPLKYPYGSNKNVTEN